MKAKTTAVAPQNTAKRLAIWALVVGAILMIPIIGQWPWGSEDFIFGFVMLFGSATVYELATRNMTNRNHRLAVGAVVFMVLSIVWVLAATG